MQQESEDLTEHDVQELLKHAFSEVPFPFAGADAESQPLVQWLRKAFGEAPYPYNGVDPDSNDDDVPVHKWFYDLPLFMPNVFQYVLPRLLVVLFDVYPEPGSYTDTLLRHLDVPGIDRDIANSIAPHLWDRDTLFQAQESSFSLFTVEQIAALIQWLRLVGTWGEGELRPKIDSAIVYWEEVLKRGKS